MNRPEILAERGDAASVPPMCVAEPAQRTLVAADDMHAWPGWPAARPHDDRTCITAVAPGKVVIMGEHASAYGRPAIAAALGLHCRASVRAEAEEGVRVELPADGVRIAHAREELEDYAAMARVRRHLPSPETPAWRAQGGDPLHLARLALGACLRHVRHLPRGLSLRIESPLPHEAGFGSSAAIAVSIVAALLALDGDAADIARIEAIAHDAVPCDGSSGIGRGAVLHGGLVRAARLANGAPVLAPLPFRRERLRRLQLYHSGPPAEAAGEVAAAVHECLAQASDRGALLASMERATLAFGAWLAGKGDLALGGVAVVRDYERCLERLGVVPASVRAAIRAIEAAGGAAKVSGTGALSGSGAGALLVLWPGRPALSMSELAGWERCTAPLGIPGLRVAREAAAA